MKIFGVFVLQKKFALVSISFYILTLGLSHNTLQDVGIYNAQGFLLGRPEAADYWVKKFGLAPNGNKHLLSAE